MPYIINFSKPLTIINREQNINDCCIGGDIVLTQLHPCLQERYDDYQTNQEDWGWFAWFKRSGINFAVDVYTNDEAAGSFQIYLTSRKRQFLFGSKIQDAPELETLRALVVTGLQIWQVDQLKVLHVNATYQPD